MWIVIGAYPDGEIDERLWFRSLTSPTFLKMIVEVVVKNDTATSVVVEGNGTQLIPCRFVSLLLQCMEQCSSGGWEAIVIVGG